MRLNKSLVLSLIAMLSMVFSTVLLAGTDYSPDYRLEPLMKAIEKNDIETLTALLKEKVDPNDLTYLPKLPSKEVTRILFKDAPIPITSANYFGMVLYEYMRNISNNIYTGDQIDSLLNYALEECGANPNALLEVAINQNYKNSKRGRSIKSFKIEGQESIIQLALRYGAQFSAVKTHRSSYPISAAALDLCLNNPQNPNNALDPNAAYALVLGTNLGEYNNEKNAYEEISDNLLQRREDFLKVILAKKGASADQLLETAVNQSIDGHSFHLVKQERVIKIAKERGAKFAKIKKTANGILGYDHLLSLEAKEEMFADPENSINPDLFLQLVLRGDCREDAHEAGGSHNPTLEHNLEKQKTDFVKFAVLEKRANVSKIDEIVVDLSPELRSFLLEHGLNQNVLSRFDITKSVIEYFNISWRAHDHLLEKKRNIYKSITLLKEKYQKKSQIDHSVTALVNLLEKAEESVNLHKNDGLQPYINIEDDNGQTLVMLAAKAGLTGLVELFINVLGADWQKKDLNGKTALMLAEENGHHDSVLISILKYGKRPEHN